MTQDRELLFKKDIRTENDVVIARQTARIVADKLGFEGQEQVRIATAVSEIVRNAFRYAGAGTVEFVLLGEGPTLAIYVDDKGPGIRNLDDVLNGRYRSETGMGMGIIGATRLMDRLDVRTSPGNGTRVEMEKRLPRRAAPLNKDQVRKGVQAAVSKMPSDTSIELQQQNRELLSALEQLNVRQAELERLNRELDETNRGVVALYAELDERAELLQRTSELKSSFLSNLSHEFRTPLNSIISLSQLLMDEVDGPLTSEQRKQVGFVRRSAEGLLEMVNDLLDIAKIEAGKVQVRPEEFTVDELFGALRGMLRPLLTNSDVSLYFENEHGLKLHTDQSKLSQILRNFISNALKFTVSGEVRVTAVRGEHDAVSISVADTGIGIAPGDMDRIFEEFTQIDNELQKKQKGTGLGLPLSAKLAELLGGTVTVASELGKGSTFTVVVPRVYSSAITKEDGSAVARTSRSTALIIDDDEISRYVLRSLLSGLGIDVAERGNGQAGVEYVRYNQPQVVFLDLVMPGYSGFEVLRDLKADERARSTPVIVHTSKLLTLPEREQLLKDAVAIIPKASESREDSVRRVTAALEKAGISIEQPGTAQD